MMNEENGKSWSAPNSMLWNGHEFREPNHDDYRFLRDNPTTLVIEPTTVAIHLGKMGGVRQ